MGANIVGHNRGPKWQRDERWAPIVSAMEDRIVAGEAQITYAELSSIAGVPCNSQSWAVRKALANLQKRGVYCDPLPGVGYLRLDNNGKYLGVHKKRRKGYRAVTRAYDAATAVDDAGLSRQARPTHWANMANLQLAKRALHGNAVNAAARKQSHSLVDEERKQLSRRLNRP